MKRLMIAGALVLAILVFGAVGLAADYYVDPTGTDDGTHGTDTGGGAFKTIQYAIDDSRVVTGDTIDVAAGTYDEQVVIDKALTLQGAGDTTILQPTQDTVDTFQIFGRRTPTHAEGVGTTAAIVVVSGVNGSGRATIQDIKIDALNVATGNSGATKLVEMLCTGSNATIDGVTFYGNLDWPDDALYLTPWDQTAVTVEVKNCDFSRFWFNAITANYAGLTANIHHNTITGRGETTVTAGNGIQYGWGCTGTASYNTISDLAYISGSVYVDAGIMFWCTNGTASNNTIIDCQTGVMVQANEAGTFTVTVENNTISAPGLSAAVPDIEGINVSANANNPSITATIQGNDLSGGGLGDGIGIGLSEGGDSPDVDATISNNEISGWHEGIWLGESTGTVTITGNTITNNDSPASGIHVIASVDVSNVEAHLNNIEGNTGYGVYNGGTGTLNAENNWWGANDGPSHSPGSGDKVSDNVNYDPWLVVNIEANPVSIPADGTSTSNITADLNHNSDGIEVGGPANHVPDGIGIYFTTNAGAIGSLTTTKATTNGQATATLTSSTTVESADVTAQAPAKPGNEAAATMSTAVFFTKTGVNVTDSKTQGTDAGTQTVDATGEANTEVTKEGDGTPTVTVAQYSDNPAGPNTFQTFDGSYVDVHLDDVTDVTQVTLKFYYPKGISESPVPPVYYWTGGSWKLCSDQTAHTGDTNGYGGYIEVRVRNDTVPSLDDLTRLELMIAIANHRPWADAGPDQTVNAGATVQLDGKGSDPDGDSLSYCWNFLTKPAGSTAHFSRMGIPNPTFVADKPGRYFLVFTVSDNRGASTSVNLTVIAGPGGERCCQLFAGWNLISLPVQPHNSDPKVVFTDDLLYLCTYNTATGVFQWVDKPPSATLGTAGALTTVDPLAGYWLAVQQAGQYCVSGTALTGDQVVDLSTWSTASKGWFMIGVPYETAWGNATGAALKFTHAGVNKWLTQAVDAGWLYGTILNWDATPRSPNWVRTTVEAGTTLEPCVGYWIRARVHDLTMTFTTSEWDPGNPPSFSTQSLKSEDPGNPPMPIHVTPLTFDASKLVFGNYPNPVTDVHTTHFAVMGAMAAFVEAIKVDIYDLSGQKVYSSGEITGTSVDWHTDNDYGEYLANGVYLYKMYANVEGQWVVSTIKKIAILR